MIRYCFDVEFIPDSYWDKYTRYECYVLSNERKYGETRTLFFQRCVRRRMVLAFLNDLRRGKTPDTLKGVREEVETYYSTDDGYARHFKELMRMLTGQVPFIQDDIAVLKRYGSKARYYKSIVTRLNSVHIAMCSDPQRPRQLSAYVRQLCVLLI